MAALQEFNEYGYEGNDIEDEIMLSDLPLSLLMETIRSQFDDPMEYRKKDYIQSFLNKYEYTKNNITEEESDDLEVLYDKFISFMKQIFKQYLGIGLPNIDDDSEEDQEELIHFIYRYFISDIRKNFVNFVFNYIKDRKESLAEGLEKKKDVTTFYLKEAGVEDDDVTIISNLSDIINGILEEEFTIDEFFEYSKTGKTELDIEFVSDKYDTNDITGNFVPYYFRMVDDGLKVEVESKVRNKLLKKYNKIKK